MPRSHPHSGKGGPCGPRGDPVQENHHELIRVTPHIRGPQRGACLEPTQDSYEVNLQPSGGEAAIEQGEVGLSLASLTLPQRG